MNKEQRKQIIENVAARLGTNPAWLDALINFETAGTYDPLIQNYAGSSARGLIQVTDDTARKEFNYNDSLSLVLDNPYFDEQMENIVFPYLKKYSPYPTQQKLYMAVFFPYAMNRDPSTTFEEMYKELYPVKWRENFSTFQKQNKNIYTIQDYLDFVNRRIKTGSMHFPLSVIPWGIFLVGGGAILYFLYRRRSS